jgi:hypothetical protein
MKLMPASVIKLPELGKRDGNAERIGGTTEGDNIFGAQRLIVL